MPRPVAQARYWLLTIPFAHLAEEPSLSGDLCYLKGQQEIGEGGLHHWQVLAVFSKKLRLRAVKSHFVPQAHCEPSLSAAANAYVWKEDTRVAGTQFEHGELPISRARSVDWERVYDSAVIGDIEAIPKDILIRNYSALKRIGVDNAKPPVRPDISVDIYWGVSGVGKTRRAWYEAGSITDVYIKNPNTKWWDGYRGQKTVIFDEFTGRIDISYILTWLDRYPCMVEIKGYSTPLLADRFFFTSNVNPRDWYPDANPEQIRGLLRRVSITEMVFNWDEPRVGGADGEVAALPAPPGATPLGNRRGASPASSPLRGPSLIATPETSQIEFNVETFIDDLHEFWGA